jgi:hypothetical protein
MGRLYDAGGYPVSGHLYTGHPDPIDVEGAFEGVLYSLNDLVV